MPSYGEADKTSPTLWLSEIKHTGSATTGGGSTDPITLPAVSFTGVKLADRVDARNYPELNRFRIDAVTTETGAIIQPTYELVNPCAVPVTVKPESNTSSCYPVSWTPPGYSKPIIDWFNKYVVTKVVATDPSGGAPARVTSYEYPGGAAWHFDDNEVVKPKYRTYGQFRGYGRVLTRDGDGVNDRRTLQETTFYRGMSRNNSTPVTLTDSIGGTHDDADELAGEVLEETAYLGDGGAVDHSTISSYWVSPATATRARTGLSALTATMRRPVLSYTRQAVTSSGSTQWWTTAAEISFDPDPASPTFGLARAAYSHTVPADPVFDRCAVTGYAPVNPALNLVGLVAELETTSVACSGHTPGAVGSVPGSVNTLTAPATVSRPAQVVSATRTFYDDPEFGVTFPQAKAPTRGDVTMTQVGDDADGAFSFRIAVRTSYDSRGRAETIYDSKGNKNTTSYTDDAVGLNRARKTTNAAGHSATTTVDPQRHQALTVTDPNGLVTTSQYDPLGRITSVWLNNRATSTKANYLFSYTVERGVAPAAMTKRLKENTGYLISTLIYDSLYRQRQTQTETPQGGRLVTDTLYDSRGWVRATNNDWWMPDGSPSTTPLDASNATKGIPNQTFNTFDGLGRVVRADSAKDNQVVSSTTTVYQGDRTLVIPPPGGGVKATTTNIAGQTIQLDDYPAAPTVTAPDDLFTGSWSVTGGSSVTTRYGYDARDNQTRIVDAQNRTWTSTFNLMGKVVAKTDPDTGPSTLKYDVNGNLVESTDARGKTVSSTYDAINRQTAQYAAPVNGQSDNNRLASWVFDNANNAAPKMKYPIGQLTTATSYHPDLTYSTQVTDVDVFGNSLGETITVTSGTYPLLAGTRTYKHLTSRNLGLPVRDVYPAGGGLPAEPLDYLYDTRDMLTMVGGLTGYSQGTTYDAWSRPIQGTMGSSPNQAYLTNIYDPHTGWLKQQLVTRRPTDPSGGFANREDYTYDLVGHLTRQVSTRNGSTTPAETRCYRYDQLSRLTDAWTATDPCGRAPTETDHSTVGNPLGTASAYWTSWTFDALGNRTQQTQHGLSDEADTVTDYTYNTSDSGPAHALLNTRTTTGAVTSDTSYNYDEVGNTTTRTTPTQGVQTFTWNDTGRVDTITGPDGISEYRYGADGNLILRKDPNSTTLYLPGQENTLDHTTNTVKGARYYPLPAGGMVVRTGTQDRADITFEITDGQGSPTVYLDSTAQKPTWRQYTPYGEPRGQASAWPDQHGFLNQTENTSTGLAELGARLYDATIGRFISVDPLLAPAESQLLNGYGYTSANPIGESDPTGLIPGDPLGYGQFYGEQAAAAYEDYKEHYGDDGTTFNDWVPPTSGRKGGGSSGTGSKPTKKKNWADQDYTCLKYSVCNKQSKTTYDSYSFGSITGEGEDCGGSEYCRIFRDEIIKGLLAWAGIRGYKSPGAGSTVRGTVPKPKLDLPPKIGPYISKGSGKDLRRSALVGDEKWHFNTGHGFYRAHTGPGGVKNDLRTTTLTPDQIEAAIVADVYVFRTAGGVVPRAGSAGFAGPLERYVDVGGASIGYRVSQSPDGALRVGTYWNNSW